jgi:hypothetical protein
MVTAGKPLEMTQPDIPNKLKMRQLVRMNLASWLPLSRKKELRSLLLNIKDVPSAGFDIRTNRSFRTGRAVKDNHEVLRRTLEMRSVTVSRTMRNSRSRRALTVEVISFATHADAETSLTSVRSDLRVMPGTPEMDCNEANLEHALEGVSRHVALELNAVEPSRKFGMLVFAGVYGAYEFVLVFGSQAEMWTWGEALPIIEHQVQKFRQR